VRASQGLLLPGMAINIWFEGSSASVAPAFVGKAKAAGNYVRGTRRAMRRDTKSARRGAVVGAAPAWIAEARDRSKFLMASGDEADDAATSGVVSKAKTALKKALMAVGATSADGRPKNLQPPNIAPQSPARL
jgi:hypothetical protein